MIPAPAIPRDEFLKKFLRLIPGVFILKDFEVNALYACYSFNVVLNYTFYNPVLNIRFCFEPGECITTIFHDETFSSEFVATMQNNTRSGRYLSITCQFQADLYKLFLI